MRGGKRWGSKKGISPLIATVLLVAFAVALGAMIMNWSSNLLSESSAEGACSKAKISLVGKFCFKDNQVSLEILNSGQIDVEEVVLRTAAKDFENEIHMKDSKLGVNQRLVKQLPYLKGGDGTKYMILPTVGAEGQRVLCEKAGVKLDRLENC